MIMYKLLNLEYSIHYNPARKNNNYIPKVLENIKMKILQMKVIYIYI